MAPKICNLGVDLANRVSARMKQLGYGPKAIRQILLPVTGKKAMKKDTAFVHVSPIEEELMKHLHSDGLGVKKVAAAMGRSTDTVSKHLFRKNKTKSGRVGPKVIITENKYKQMEKAYQKLLRQAKGKEVTVAVLKKELKLKCSLKTISRAFWAHGVHFRPLYEKPDLSPEDVKERFAWAEAHSHRSYLHAIIDNKTFQVYHTGKARDHAARRSIRGAYRSKRRVFTAGYTKPPAALKQNTGAKSAQVTCAIGNGKVLMWHVTKGQWNGASAASMYCGPLQRALAREYPDVRGSWRVLEDNDPSGYKSSKGLAAKAYAGIVTLDLPKRSPDLNPLDYSLWAEVNRKMRRMESKWPNNKRETRQAYLARLKRTACSLSTDYVSSIVGALAGRVQQVITSHGSFFPEGGHQ
ncbi:unnamed protein product [Effrenium voratum]|nr:unnamed protein product [Effrenium voratum]